MAIAVALAALRKEDGKHVPDLPPLASKGPDEPAAESLG
jgi:hypothetical protein